MDANQIGEKPRFVGHDKAAGDETRFLSDATIVGVAIQKQVAGEERQVRGLYATARASDTLKEWQEKRNVMAQQPTRQRLLRAGLGVQDPPRSGAGRDRFAIREQMLREHERLHRENGHEV